MLSGEARKTDMKRSILDWISIYPEFIFPSGNRVHKPITIIFKIKIYTYLTNKAKNLNNKQKEIRNNGFANVIYSFKSDFTYTMSLGFLKSVHHSSLLPSRYILLSRRSDTLLQPLFPYKKDL